MSTVAWMGGRVVPLAAIAVPADDRVFQDGLGLFETFRTWNGRAPLLGRHLDRLRGSAADLGVFLPPGALPGASDLAMLLNASALGIDAVVRITTSGGSPTAPAVVWMVARPIPGAEPSLLHVAADRGITREGHPSRRYKMLNYWERRRSFDDAVKAGYHERLFGSPDGLLWEASRSNVLLLSRSDPVLISTPSLRGPVLPGVMRAAVLAAAGEGGDRVDDRRDVAWDEMFAADAVVLSNSVRGIRPVASIEGRALATAANLDLVETLASKVSRWLGLG